LILEKDGSQRIWQGEGLDSENDARRVNLVLWQTRLWIQRNPDDDLEQLPIVAITIYGPYDMLRDGAVLVDLPITDDSSARHQDFLGSLDQVELQPQGWHPPQITQLWLMSNTKHVLTLGEEWLSLHKGQESIASATVWEEAERDDQTRRQDSWLEYWKGLWRTNWSKVMVSPACYVTSGAHWSSHAENLALLRWTFGTARPPSPIPPSPPSSPSPPSHKRKSQQDASAPKRQCVGR